jgi:hypothetical protein
LLLTDEDWFPEVVRKTRSVRGARARLPRRSIQSFKEAMARNRATEYKVFATGVIMDLLCGTQLVVGFRLGFGCVCGLTGYVSAEAAIHTPRVDHPAPPPFDQHDQSEE